MARTLRYCSAALLAAGLTQASSSPTLRDALLCIARERLDGWYEGGQKKVNNKFDSDGIKLGFLEDLLPCGGQDSIVTFAKFSVEDVKPIHVYSAIVDIVGQKAWNPAAHEIKKLKDDDTQMVRGVKLLYYATPFQDRKVYEYEAYNLTKGESWLKGDDLWFAASSCNSLQSDDHEVEQSGFMGMAKPVTAFSCLSAHHVRWAADGKTVEASFTNTINGVPPFGLSPAVVSEMTWGKTVDFIKALRVQAAKIAANDESELWTPPASLSSTPAMEYKPSMDCKALLQQQPVDVITGLWEQKPAETEVLRTSLREQPHAVPMVVVACACFSMLAAAAGLVVRRTWRSSRPDEQQSQDAEADLLAIE